LVASGTGAVYDRHEKPVFNIYFYFHQSSFSSGYKMPAFSMKNVATG